MNEIAEWKYHARELQLEALKEVVIQNIADETSSADKKIKAVQKLLLTPPVLLPYVIKNGEYTSPDEFYDLVHQGAVLRIKQTYVSSIMMALAACSKLRPKNIMEVLLDPVINYVPKGLDKALENKPEELEQISSKGQVAGENALFSVLQGSTLLMRYRKYLAANVFELTPCANGVNGFIPTKVDGVDLKLLYSHDDENPQKVSLIIRKF